MSIQKGQEGNVQFLANINTLPSGSVASKYDSYSSGAKSSSTSGGFSKSENLKDAPNRVTSPSPNNVTTPVVSSALRTCVPDEPENILIVSSCTLTSPTGPNVIGECFNRHSFSLRNANPHETLFIGWAHLSGISQAKQLAAIYQWQFQRPLQALLAVIDELDRNCSVQNAKRKPLSGAGASSRKRSSGA